MSKRKSSDSSPFQIETLQGAISNGEVQCKPKRVPNVPDHLPRLHTLCGAFGVVRSGKTNAIVNLIQAYVNAGSLNTLYCISPTYDSNGALQTLPFEEDGVFTDSKGSVEALLRILDLIAQKVRDYEEEKEYSKAYKAFKKGKQTPEQEILLARQDYRRPEPIPWPKPAIFIDDMTHTELMANTIKNELSHLSLHHRHLDNVGVSIFQAFQTFKSGKLWYDPRLKGRVFAGTLTMGSQVVSVISPLPVWEACILCNPLQATCPSWRIFATYVLHYRHAQGRPIELESYYGVSYM